MSWLKNMSPMPAFPDYTGPYKVGSVDLEIPVANLDSPSPSPDAAKEISTVAFRMFYPCEESSRDRPVRWLAYPHRGYVQAFAQFLGAGNVFSQLFSYFPHLFYYANIPVRSNAAPLDPNSDNGRWPTMIFSHGLGGSRNAYSHICGTLASHGVIVIAPEHRDGSSPVTYIQTASDKKPRPVFYRRKTHTPSLEVYEHRDNQLKVRLWELGLIHDALLKIDAGKLTAPPMLSQTNREQGELNEVVLGLANKMDMLEPGRLILAGHSFGAATCVQFTKSIYYNRQSDDPDYQPLYEPRPDAQLCRQITSETPLLLLDMWGMPFRSPYTQWLFDQALPCYDAPHGGKNVIHILSEAFFKWKDNVANTMRALSEDPTQEPGAVWERTKQPATFFYPTGSAHLSQSDFGVLFPRVTKMAFKCDEPERTLLLNERAMLQKLRELDYDVVKYSEIDEEYLAAKSEDGVEEASIERQTGDWRILSTNGGTKGWVSVPVDYEDEGESSGSDSGNAKSAVEAAGMKEGQVLGEVVEQSA